MEIDPKNLSDEQLDAMLRDVSVPSELKNSLREIATTSTVELHKPENGKGRAMPWIMFMAASLLAVAAFMATQWLPNAKPNSSIASGESANSDNIPTVDLPEVNPEQVNLAELDVQLKSLTAMIDQLEIQRLRQQIDLLEQQSTAELEQKEISSMIVALSDQTSLPLGGDSDTVKSDMARVIEKFPGTRGAEIARTYLRQINN